jgi:formamidopyrimidine-DNA glycosylase
MPELPEVETTIRGLAPVLEGRRIASVELRRGDLRRPFPHDLEERLTGARITGLRRRAKYGLIDTDRGETLVFHLGMSGSWRLDQQEVGRHDHVILTTDQGRALSLNDPRRFGSLDLLPTATLEALPPFAGMGPEPMSEEFDGAWLKVKLAGRAGPIKPLLLDQRIVAGLGNIYACEALFLAGVAPAAPAGALSRSRLDRLASGVKQVLAEAIGAGGSSLRNYVQPSGELGYFAAQWRVYGREGLPCVICFTPVRRRTDGGRSTLHCPKCQRR